MLIIYQVRSDYTIFLFFNIGINGVDLFPLRIRSFFDARPLPDDNRLTGDNVSV